MSTRLSFRIIAAVTSFMIFNPLFNFSASCPIRAMSKATTTLCHGGLSILEFNQSIAKYVFHFCFQIVIVDSWKGQTLMRGEAELDHCRLASLRCYCL